jgi:hypothetical protein
MGLFNLKNFSARFEFKLIQTSRYVQRRKIYNL